MRKEKGTVVKLFDKLCERLAFATTLYLSGFDHQHDAFRKTVHALGIVFFLQRGAEAPGEYLPEASTQRPHEGLDHVVARGMALAVDEFDEQFAL